MPFTEGEQKKLLEDIQVKLTDYQGQLEVKIQDHIKNGLGDSDKKVEDLKKDIEQVHTALDSLKQQIRYIGIGVPGLKEALDRRETDFSWQSLVKGLYRIANPSADSGAGGPWAGCEKEKEIIDAYDSELRTRATGNYAADGSAGGYLIPPEISNELIGLVYAAIPMIDKLPITKVNGLFGQFIIPKLTGTLTAYMVGENTAPSTSAATYGQLVLDPKRIAGLTFQSKSLVYQSRGTSDMIIKQELVRSIQQKMHEMLMLGSGNDFQPCGLDNAKWSVGTSTNAGETNGGRFTITDAMLLKMDLETSNEGSDNPGNYGYLMRPEVKYGMMTERVKQYAAQTSKTAAPVIQNLGVLDENTLRSLIGNFATTTQLSATQTKGSDTTNTLSTLYYGNWPFFWLCNWQGLSVRVSDIAYVSTISAFAQNGMWIIAEQGFNCAVTRATAFKKCTGAQCDPNQW